MIGKTCLLAPLDAYLVAVRKGRVSSDGRGFRLVPSLYSAVRFLVHPTRVVGQNRFGEPVYGLGEKPNCREAMSSKNRLSREEKGNVIEVSSNPHKDVTVNVADAHRAIREERAERISESDDDDSSLVDNSSNQGGSKDDDSEPTVYHPGGIFEELAPLPPEMLRDPWAEGQNWENVFGTCSTHKSVKELLRR
ncbi:hypothetical protein Bca4012_025930 [Brassica carinata]